jgi:hypothetical protein
MFGNVSVVGPDGELGWKPMHGDAREVGLSLDVLSSPSVSSALKLVKRSVDDNTGVCLRAENGRNQLSICPTWEDETQGTIKIDHGGQGNILNYSVGPGILQRKALLCRLFLYRRSDFTIWHPDGLQEAWLCELSIMNY